MTLYNRILECLIVLILCVLITGCCCGISQRNGTDDDHRWLLKLEEDHNQITVSPLVIPELLEAFESEQITWYYNGVEVPQSASRIDGKRNSFSFTPYAGETIVEARINHEDVKVPVKSISLFAIEPINSPPVIDGSISVDEWGDLPVVRMWPSKNFFDSDSEEASLLTQAEYSAEIRGAYDESNLYFAFDVTDTTPLEGFDRLEVTVLTSSSKEKSHLSLRFVNPHPLLRATGVNSEQDSEYATESSEGSYQLEGKMPAGKVVGLGNYGDIGILTFAVWDIGGDENDRWLRHLTWKNSNPYSGYLLLLPDPSTRPPGPGRQQIKGGATELNISPVATKDPAYLTPLPVERPEDGAHLPQGLVLQLPFETSQTVSAAYGYESTYWTHQTIGNRNSANDFFALDFDMEVGTPVLSVADGRVVTSNRRGDGYGNYVVIDHGLGVTSVYAHLDSLVHQVDKGGPMVYVEAGEIIGLSGQTGTGWPHLHMAIHTDSRLSHSGADVGGKATVPEPLGGYYGIRDGHTLIP